MKRVKIEVQGQVQGVGFRPQVYRLASKFNLTGSVKNIASGVALEIQGHAIDDFLQCLNAEVPPLAQIDSMHCENIPVKLSEKCFVIESSERGSVCTKISPDVVVCELCLKELFDQNSRYYRYPFINCVHCGPRYTITDALPYDRSMTRMAAFKMCEVCCCEYEDPLSRRYHAQAMACSQCGPQLSCCLEAMGETIRRGETLALKGLGGYQLVCDARDDQAVQGLRKKKERSSKPFAVMVLNAASAKKIVQCDEEAEAILTSKERPIVVLPKKNSELSGAIAPGLNSLGVMLPSTPLHYLLFHVLLDSPDGVDWLHSVNDWALVVTSANPGGCPLIKDNQEAEEKLSSIADRIVHTNREIAVRVDDSVVSLLGQKSFYIRRARGYVPQAIALPYEVPKTLALGAYLKNTVCVTRGREAFVSQHVGDLNNRETIRFYRETIDHLLKILDVEPECVAHDWHPDFYSTRMADEFNVPAFSVQHHHAHLAACAVEYGIVDRALGVALDGFGLGENQESWGGELMCYQGVDFQRLGSLQAFMQPGGDRVVRQPWRMAVSVLFELGLAFEHSRAESITALLEKKINSPYTSSCGRLFDAASALLGICETSTYEGEAAMLLESQVTEPMVLDGGWSIDSNQLSLLPLFKVLTTCDAVSGANLFHGTLAKALAEWINDNAKALSLKHVLMSGGCLMNRILSERLIDELNALGLIALYPRQLPPNDGGISLGQAWVAGNKILRGIPLANQNANI